MSVSSFASSTGSTAGSSKSKDMGVSRLIMKARSRSHRLRDHKCGLVTQSVDDLDKLYPLSFWRRCQARLHKSILVSGSNRRCQAYLRSSAAVNLEEERHLVSVHWYIIHPFSEFRVVWESIFCVALVHFCLVYPFSMSFGVVEYGSHYEPLIYAPDHFVTLLFLFDIIITFMTGIIEKRTKEIILDPWIISRKYLRGYFVWDVLTTIPWEIWSFAVSTDDGTTFWAAVVFTALMSALNFYRVLQLLRILGELFEVAGFSKTSFRLISLLTKYVIYLHWAACASWLLPYVVHQGNLSNEPKSWIVHYGLVDRGNLTYKLLQAWSRAISVSLKLGYGHSYGQEAVEDSIVNTFILIVGFLFNAIIFGVFLHFIITRYASDIKYQSTIIQLREYMRFKKLPPSTQERMFMYYENKFQKGYFKESAIMATLSGALREEISMHCCQRLVTEVELFANLPPPVVVAVISRLHPEIYLPTDVIVKAGYPGDCMFFMQIGTAAVFTATGKEVCHIQDGDYFGEVALIEKNTRRVASVIAVDICEVYRLDRADFVECIANEPAVLADLERMSRTRKEETYDLEQEYKRKLADIDVVAI